MFHSFTPRFFARMSESAIDPSDEYPGWHCHDDYVLRPKGVGGDGCRQSGIDAPRQPDYDLLEAILPNVVPRPDCQGLVDLFQVWEGGLGGGVDGGVSGVGIDVHHEQVLFELLASGQDVPRR